MKQRAAARGTLRIDTLLDKNKGRIYFISKPFLKLLRDVFLS